MVGIQSVCPSNGAEQKEAPLRRVIAVIALIIVPSASLYAIETVRIELDHRTGTLKCGSQQAAGICTATAPSSSEVNVAIIGTVPDLIEPNVEVKARHTTDLQNIAKILFPAGSTPTTSPKTSSEQITRAMGQSVSSATQALDLVTNSIEGIQDAIYEGKMDPYPVLKQQLRIGVEALTKFAGKKSMTVPAMFAAEKTPLPQNADPETWWKNVLAIDAASNTLTSYARSFELEDDTDLIITFKSKNPLIKEPKGAQATLRVNDWRLTTTTGFAGSGLIDDHFSFRTVTDKEATDTTAAVTHREAVREERDIANAEATYFVHLDSLRAPFALSFGVGIGTGASGRLYSGLSWRLGNRGALTVGGALGQVKRLSKNIDEKNLGANVDPEATRRSVMRAAPFLAVSWRLGQ
jgi:hypothetical protein